MVRYVCLQAKQTGVVVDLLGRGRAFDDLARSRRSWMRTYVHACRLNGPSPASYIRGGIPWISLARHASKRPMDMGSGLSLWGYRGCGHTGPQKIEASLAIGR
jgi:hypothetical protein